MQQQPNGAAARGAPPPAPAPQAPPMPPPADMPGDDQSANFPPLTGDFREWCIAQVLMMGGWDGVRLVYNHTWWFAMMSAHNETPPQTRKLLGTDDLTFIEMLMGVPANGEVAEIIAANFDSSPESAGFAAEFIRRKTEYIARGGAEGKRRKRR